MLVNAPVRNRQKVPCPLRMVYNPLSKRCVNINTPIGRLINAVEESIYLGINFYDCPANEIYHPLYKSSVPRQSLDGKLIDAVLVSNGCPAGYVYDLSSGRCIKATGKCGVRLLGKWHCARYPERSPQYQFYPTPAQLDIANYFSQMPYRGILLNWSLGSGKTCAASLMIDQYLKSHAEVKKIYVFSSGSLRDNFLDQYCTICGEDPKRINTMFDFITYNYSLIKDELPIRQAFDNSIVVIDEVHNVIRGFINKSENYVAIYNLLASLTTTKFIFLSGTPVTRYKEELYYILNLINPNAFTSLDQFNNHFVNLLPDQSIISAISSVISRLAVANSLDYYPTTSQQFITVPMTNKQYSRWYNIRDSEKESHPPNENDKMRRPEKYKKDLTYHILSLLMLRSRQAGNMIYPDYIYDNWKTAPPDKLIPEGGWIDSDFIEHLADYAPKFVVLLNLINQIPGKHVVYSEFKTRYGVYIIDTILKYYDIKTLLYTGDLNDAERNEVTRNYNSPENNNGEKYKVLLVTEAGAEGTNFLAAHALHIMESNIDEFSIRQVEGRVVRYSSHLQLPVDERYVILIRYFAIMGGENVSFDQLPYDRQTSDSQAYDNGMDRINDITPILNLLNDLPIVPVII